MRLHAPLLTLLLFVPLVSVAAPSAGGPTYRIVLPRRAVAAGDHLYLKVVPPPPLGSGVTWTVMLTPNEGIGLPGGIYWAPYSIPVAAPPATVRVQIRDGRAVSVAKAEIELMPGSIPGAQDCLGSDQSFSIAAAALTPPNPLITSGGDVVRKVDPIYPRSAFVRGVRDTIQVQALVCRTGRVLDAHELPTYRDNTNPFDPDPSTLVQHDPKLVDAAIAAVRQYAFNPAIANGRPVAFQVVTTVILNP